jgi:hypothetical protein
MRLPYHVPHPLQWGSRAGIHGTVLQVRVLNDHHVAPDLGKTGAQRRAFALIAVVVKGPDIVILLDQPVQDVPGAVRRRIVHGDDFLVVRGLLHQPEDLLQGVFLVVNRNDDAQLHVSLMAPVP